MKKYSSLTGAIIAGFAIALPLVSLADAPLDRLQAHPPIHVHRNSTSGPVGYTPAQIKSAYNLPTAATAGAGKVIAIVDAYDAPTIESDLNTFSAQYGLPACTTSNGCFRKYKMTNKIRTDSGWALEASLDTQWAHAIAPGAKILFVEAKSASFTDLINAVNWAKNQPGVVAVSMSWGGNEFSSETSYDSTFTAGSGVVFFASSGDSGYGVQWPAVSPNVVAVGGTTLTLGSTTAETAWSGSGGGVSAYETVPAYQSTYGITGNNGKRGVPDVSYNADPATGVAVYDSTPYQGVTGWFQVGGTSAGAPQWAAIKAVGGTAANSSLYTDAKTAYASYFRDVTVGSNGSCGVICAAQSGYDYVTGLGSPLTSLF